MLEIKNLFFEANSDSFIKAYETWKRIIIIQLLPEFVFPLVNFFMSSYSHSVSHLMSKNNVH